MDFERLAELVAVNNMRFNVEGRIGQPIKCSVNRYGRLGLTIDEAFELTYYRGFFEATYKTDKERFKMFAEVLRIAKGDLIEIATPEQIKALARTL